jgi:predicted CopG family antitoxin
LKRPKKITITVNHSLYTKLLELSSSEGRSISNLASYLLQHDLEGLS